MNSQLDKISHWRKFPDALLIDDELPLSAKIIWIVVGSFSPYEDPCRASVRRIGERIGISRSQAHNLIAKLIKTGWLSRNPDGDLVRHIPAYAAHNLRLWEEKSRVKTGIENLFKKPQKVSGLSDIPSSLSDTTSYLSDTSVRSECHDSPISVTQVSDLSDITYIDKRIEIKERDKGKREESAKSETPKKKTPVSDIVFSKDTWQHEFASAFYENMKARQRLGSKFQDKPEDTIQKWAHVFRRLENRYQDQGRIKRLCKHLFTTDDFWIQKRALRSPAKLLELMDDKSQYYFDFIESQMNDSHESTKAHSDDLSQAEYQALTSEERIAYRMAKRRQAAGIA